MRKRSTDNSPGRIWVKRHKEAADYIQEVGIFFTRKDNPQVYDWLGVQRRNIDKLSVKQKEMLEEIPGFSWTKWNDYSWEQKYQKIAKKVESTGKTPSYEDDRNDYFWLYYNSRNRDKLTKEQQLKLEKFPGFTWGTRNPYPTWTERYQKVETKAKTLGRLPTRKEDPSSYDWIQYQKRNKNRLTIEQQKQLEELSGFTWKKQKTTPISVNSENPKDSAKSNKNLPCSY